MKQSVNVLIIIFLFFISISCNNTTENKKETSQKKEKVTVPDFNSDTAYYYVKKQVDFGPRVPNTLANINCMKFLSSTLKRYTSDVIIQNFKAKAYNGETLIGNNIIAVFNPELKNRIMLCAHWDSRPYADHDPDKKNHNTPIDGANDGASGVGVLIELARQMNIKKPEIGVDIILFDTEDYGPPQDKQLQSGENFWALGAQYWAKNPHVPDYKAKFGVLLDMVGASDAKFPKEGFSMNYAPEVVEKIWNIGNDIGYNDYFLNQRGSFIDDDHYYINKIINIPTIDIIHLDPNSRNGTFFEHWHTLKDNINTIDKTTLKVVGQTLLFLIYEEK